MHRGDHLDFRVALHLPRELIDQLRIDQRLVALDVDDVRDAAQFRRDFRDPIGPAGVTRTR